MPNLVVVDNCGLNYTILLECFVYLKCYIILMECCRWNRETWLVLCKTQRLEIHSKQASSVCWWLVSVTVKTKCCGDRRVWKVKWSCDSTSVIHTPLCCCCSKGVLSPIKITYCVSSITWLFSLSLKEYGNSFMLGDRAS